VTQTIHTGPKRGQRRECLRYYSATPPPRYPSPLCYTSAPSPTLQRKVASAVAWETRERGGRYYTRSRREDGRVVREYLGGGLVGELASEMDRSRRERRAIDDLCRRRELERLEALAAPVEELSEAAEILLRAHLIDAGYRRGKGVWRRARSA
jgi:hypothetical protein